MRTNYLTFIMFLMAVGCSPSTMSQEEIAELRRAAQTDYDRAACSEAASFSADEQGELAEAQADVGIGDTAKSTPESESGQFRDLVASTNGILPSQADGWRELLVDRGNHAQETVDRLRSRLTDAETARKEACNRVAALVEPEKSSAAK